MTLEAVSIPNPVEDDKNAEAEAAALKAAEDGGVIVNGEAVESPEGEQQVAQRPDNVPEKFWDAEKGEVNVSAILESNKELQAQFTKEKQGEQAEGKPGEAAGEASDAENPVIAARQYFDQHQELSDEHYKALEAAGLDREFVDNYIEGQQAIVANVMQHAYGLAGGSKETFEAMNQWASENLTPEELAAHNIQVQADETSDYAISSLYQRYKDESPNEASLLSGENSNLTSGDYFKSSAEMQAAMQDDRYAVDPAFRQEVQNKIARADAAGVHLFG